MNLKVRGRPTASGPPGRSAMRRGTFALEPIEALPRLADRIVQLAQHALEPNPFFLPEFLEPALHALGRRGLRLAVCSDRDGVWFFAPVLTSGGSLLSARKFAVWTHAYAPLGVPLIHRDMAAEVTDGLLAHMRTTRRALLAVPHLPLDGPVAQALTAAAERSGFAVVGGTELRPILYPRRAAGIADFERMVSHKRRHELERQLRRLCETGAVSFFTAHTASEIDAAFNMFLELEAAGWKGRRGTALMRRRTHQEFARMAVTRLAQAGVASIDVMRLGDRPLAALIRFDHQGLSIPWKIAFDERYAHFSPGRQLMCDETRRWLADRSIHRVDPICEEGNPLIAPLWPDRERYAMLVVSTRRWSVAARLRAGVANLRAGGKKAAKTLLGRRRAKKPPPAKEQAPQRKERPRPVAPRPADDAEPQRRRVRPGPALRGR